MEKQVTASITDHLQNLLQPHKSGEILLVTSSGIYLKFGKQILLLCDSSWGVLPIGIGIDNFDGVTRRLHPQQGQPVSLREERLVFPAGNIRLINKQPPGGMLHELIPQTSKIRQAAEELAALRKQRGISMLVLPLVLGRELRDQWAENPYCSCARHYLDSLITAFDCCDGEKIRNSTEKLLGLGQGLTPSADDVLLGMLYVFGVLPEKSPKAVALFRENIMQLCEQRTNQISAAYLKAIIAGAPFERMAHVLHGLCGEETLDIQMLTQIGSSSGSEMLLGMLLALRICGYNVSQKEILK